MKNIVIIPIVVFIALIIVFILVKKPAQKIYDNNKTDDELNKINVNSAGIVGDGMSDTERIQLNNIAGGLYRILDIPGNPYNNAPFDKYLALYPQQRRYVISTYKLLPKHTTLRSSLYLYVPKLTDSIDRVNKMKLTDELK